MEASYLRPQAYSGRDVNRLVLKLCKVHGDSRGQDSADLDGTHTSYGREGHVFCPLISLHTSECPTANSACGDGLCWRGQDWRKT